MKRTTVVGALCAMLTIALSGCQAKKSSNPLSPSVAGPIEGVNITAPKLLEPAQGFKYKESQQPIKLLVENATSSGVRVVSYMFEVATDTDFASKVFARAGVAAGDGGRTSVQIDRLDTGRAYYWRARAEDGANSSLFSTAQFEVLPRPVLNAPALHSPINNERVASRRPTLVVGNSDRNAAVSSLSYEFQLATDQGFGQLVSAGIVDEGSGQTGFVVNVDLASDRQMFWRARASDGETISGWAATQTFRSAIVVATPTPTPGPNPGGPCNSKSPQSIVECERAKYGRMSSGQLLEFERAVARSLNSNGISGGPFGILRKSGGANCGGFSCDIICAGQGNDQGQWDILGDSEGAQNPAWNGPNRVPNIRVDVCEIQ
ncbi:MAG: hypothetical protein ABJC89_12105 [Acidobacteriota bacterium]